MKLAVISIIFTFIAGGCVYTPSCTPPPLKALDGPVALALLPNNMLYVINSNIDSRYCSSFISKISLSSPQQPLFNGVAPIQYKGTDISLVSGAYLSTTTGLLWIADRENNRLLLFDTAANSITATIPVDLSPVSIAPIGISNGDQLMLACNLVSNDVSVVSSDLQKELYKIPLTNNGTGVSPLNSVVTPYPVIINNQPPDQYAYITRGADNNISVVSMNKRCEFNPMFPSSASSPVFSTVTPGNAATMSTVQTHTCKTLSELWTVSFTPATSDFIVNGSSSGEMHTHAKAGLPYTADNGDIGFTIYQPLYNFTAGDHFTFYTSASSGLINIPNYPGSGIGTATPATKGIAMTPDLRKLFVSYTGLDSVVVIDTATNSIENYIKVGKSPQAMLLSPDGSKLYVACYSSGKIYVIDTNAEAVIGIIGVGNGPFAMALSQDQHYLYVVNYNDNSLDTVDLNNFTLVNSLK